MHTKERWFCPKEKVSVTITYSFEDGYYTEQIDYVVSGGSWLESNDVKTLIKYHSTKELCLPYEQAWPPQKQVGFANPKLAPFSWSTTPVYTEKEEVIEERVFVESDYVVMGPIGKRHWVEELWAKFVSVK